MLDYVWRDLVRNPRRTLTALVGIVLGVGLFSGVLFFSDASGATLTRRAIAPLPLDMQAVLGSPLGRGLHLEERIDAPLTLRAGESARVRLTVFNDTTVPANEVVVGDSPAAPLSYVAGSTTQGGRPVPDVAGSIPLSSGPAGIGLNLGTVRPRTTVTLAYRVHADAAVPDVTALSLQGRISSRENVVPEPANAAAPVTPARLVADIRQIAGVVAADRLSYVDLAPGSLRAGAATVADPVRVFAFEPEYQRHYPSVRLAAGSLRPGAAVLSAEAARTIGAAPGSSVTIALPGGRRPLTRPVSGIADLGEAKPLFSSRKIKKFEDFLYVPNSVVVSPATFERFVQPAFAAAAARFGAVVRSLPVTEVDVLIARSRLHADPARALAQTTAIASAVTALGRGQVSLVDNISNALTVARDDAAVGRRMLVFLGLPGLLLAVVLTGFAGAVLAATQRREEALLRLRGAHRGLLLRMLAAKAAILAGVGAVIGSALGFLLVTSILGGAALKAAGGNLISSAFVAIALGMLATALALVIPGVRSARREISEERSELSRPAVPAWRRRRVDLIVVAGAAVAEVVAFFLGGFDSPPASVSEGRGAVLPSRLLLAPLLAWYGGILLAVRVLQPLAERLPVAVPPHFGPLLRGNLMRSLRRRSWALATGSVGVGLVVAFGVALAVFSATYDAAKAQDSRFTVGADLRVTPSARSALPHPTSSANRLAIGGVAAVTPVVAKLENAVLEARFNEDRRDLVAVDTRTFAQTAARSFADRSTRAALGALAARRNGLLVDEGTAEDFSIRPGDRVKALLARGTKHQTLHTFVVVGEFTRFPGFPEGVNLVVNLDVYQAATGLDAADFFLLRAQDPGRGSIARVEAALRAGPGGADPIDVQSTRTTLNKDQSSLTALDIAGLVRLDSVFTSLMSAATVGIFVLGLLLHRRREYLTLRALGVPTRTLFGLVLGEAGVVVGAGLVAGVGVGIGTGYLLVHILRPLFLLSPVAVLPTARILVLALLPVAAALTAAIAATGALRMLRPAEVLRET